MIQARAAIAHGPTQPFAIESIELDEPRADEILVRIAGVGICHTDLMLKASGRFTPGILGHEGAGTVERVGSSVTSLVPGDRVVLSFYACHACAVCGSGHPAYCANGMRPNYGGSRADGTKPARLQGAPIPSNFFYQSSFATHAIAHERSAVKITSDLPLELLGPLGCGLQTGAGAVFNVFALRRDQRIAIFGVGAVGMAAVMAAKVAGASRIIALDPNPHRLELAQELGATDAIVVGEQNVVSAIRSLSPGGVDFSLECVGEPTVLRSAVDCLRPMGVCGLVGVGRPGAEVAISMTTLLMGRSVVGIIEGDADPQSFVPRLIALHHAGEFPYDKLITVYPFEQINEAIADTASGKTVKAVLRMDTST